MSLWKRSESRSERAGLGGAPVAAKRVRVPRVMYWTSKKMRLLFRGTFPTRRYCMPEQTTKQRPDTRYRGKTDSIVLRNSENER